MKVGNARGTVKLLQVHKFVPFITLEDRWAHGLLDHRVVTDAHKYE